MRTVLVKGRADLIRTVADRLIHRGHDYAENLVVFPGKRPAHFLRKAISSNNGKGFFPPSICSMDEFIELVCSGLADLPSVNIEPVDAVALLYEIHRTASRPIGGRGFLSLDSFFPLGLRLFRDLEELFIEKVSLESIKQADSIVDEGIPSASFDCIQSVSWFYERFYDLVRKRGYSTRSLRYCTASDIYNQERVPDFSRIILAGFSGLTEAEKEIIRKFGYDSRTSLIFQDGPGIKELLLSLDIEPDIISGDDRRPRVFLYQSPDTHGQTFGLKRELMRIADSGELDERTVVVLPVPDTLFPLLHHALPMMKKENFNISMGYPLSRTPLFGFFTNLGRLMISMEGERVYVPDYLTFVLHPYVKNILFLGRADITRIIFHTIEDELNDRRTRPFLLLSELEQDEKMLESMHRRVGQIIPEITVGQIESHLCSIHDHLIRQFHENVSIADFGHKISSIVEYIYEESTAGLHPYFHPFAETFVNAMKDISCSLVKDLAFKEIESYFHFFNRYLSSCRVPFKGTPIKGLQLLGLLETRNISFDRVFVLDMNEDVIPGTDREGSLLPFKARKALNLPTYLDRDRMAAYHLHTLMGYAEEVHLFSAGGSRKEKSRFVEELLWEMQKKDGETKPEKYIRNVVYDIRLDSTGPSPIAKNREVVELLRDFEFSASSLDTYLSCQLRFYYQYLLRISERETITGDIEKVDIGRFVHDLLHDYFSKRTGRPLSPDDLNKDELTALIESRFSRDYGPPATGPLYLLKKQIQDHLTDFLRLYQKAILQEGTLEILELESDIKIIWNSFRLKGRIDRIERRCEDICIIDYKTQSNDSSLKVRHERLDPDLRETWEGAIGSLQLMFYMLLLSHDRNIPVEKIRPMFLLLGKVNLDREIEAPLFCNEDDIEGGYAKLEQVILHLLQEITDCKIPFAPACDLKKACQFCDFRSICGTQWVVKKR